MSTFNSFRKWNKKNKFGAKRTADGFPSKLESSVYGVLKLREQKGEISDIRRQQAVILQEGSAKERISWKVDFSFLENKTKTIVYCEAKGIETMDFKLKLKLWRKNPPAQLEIWKGSYQKPFLAETIKLKIRTEIDEVEK